MGRAKDAIRLIEREELDIRKKIEHYQGEDPGVERGMANHAVIMYQQYLDGLTFALDALGAL